MNGEMTKSKKSLWKIIHCIQWGNWKIKWLYYITIYGHMVRHNSTWTPSIFGAYENDILTMPLSTPTVTKQSTTLTIFKIISSSFQLNNTIVIEIGVRMHFIFLNSTELQIFIFLYYIKYLNDSSVCVRKIKALKKP